MQSGNKTPKHTYFAAANTAGGFYSCFDTLYSPDSGEWEKIYIIKGGPGTGKSSFMRRVAEAAEERGYAVEYDLCSSDPASLDGIRIPARGLAMMDGTAPHARDPKCPGAVEEIINMGMFFRVGKLKEALPDIRAAQEANAAAHRLAARYLRAAGILAEGQRILAAPAYLEEKAERTAARLLRGIRGGEPGTETLRFTTAISTAGIVHLPTAELLAEERIYVSDKKGLADFFFETLCCETRRRGIPFTRFASPLDPTRTEGLYLPASGRLFMTDRYGKQNDTDSIINTDRFFEKNRLSSVREKYRFAAKCREELMDGACRSLCEAGEHHDALESHYIAAMDFDAKEAYTNRFIRTLFGTKRKK